MAKRKCEDVVWIYIKIKMSNIFSLVNAEASKHKIWTMYAVFSTKLIQLHFLECIKLPFSEAHTLNIYTLHLPHTCFFISVSHIVFNSDDILLSAFNYDAFVRFRDDKESHMRVTLTIDKLIFCWQFRNRFFIVSPFSHLRQNFFTYERRIS